MPTTHRLARRAATAAGAFALASAMTVVTAGAAPVDGGSFSIDNDLTYSDCGFPVREVSTVSGRYTVKDSHPSTEGQFFYLQQQAQYEAVYTNLETGKQVRETWHTTFKELQPTVVSSSPDSLVITWITHETGAFDVWRDSDGKVVYRAAGNLVTQYTGTFARDDAPGGVDFTDETLVRASGRFADFDFCAILTATIG